MAVRLIPERWSGLDAMCCRITGIFAAAIAFSACTDALPPNSSAGTSTSSNTTGQGGSGDGGSGGSAGQGGSGGSAGQGGSTIIEPSGTSLLLRVVDSSNNPVAAAMITPSGDITYTTDGAGYLLLDSLVSGRFSARVEAVDYAPASVVVNVPMGAHGGVDVHLNPLPPRIAFDASTGGEIALGPVHISIPPNALVDRNGEPFNGAAEATLLPLDPLTSLTLAPGPLVGVSAMNGEEVGLSSIFMGEISLWHGAERLQLAPGKEAILEMVLPDAISATLSEGQTIPAWYLDLDAGVWREDGTGVIQASTTEPGKQSWVAQVAHFTWWNADKPFSQKNCFIVPVVLADGSSPLGIPVLATGLSYQGATTTQLTDSVGLACMDIMFGGTAKIVIGSAMMPLSTINVTGSGPASDCAGNGAACVVLSPIAIPINPICTPGTSMSCPYGGPAGTLNVGICKASVKYCNADGTGFLGCAGEVLPKPESCATPVDDDCDFHVNEEGNDCTCVPGQTMSCYTGPFGTDGVGVCKPGQRTCAPDGLSYGLCLGQILPAPETCATVNIDDDCNGTPDCQGLVSWGKQFGDAGFQEARSIAVDATGNVVVVGLFEGTIDLGGGPLVSSPMGDIFVAKLDSSGNHIWSRRFGGGTYQYANAVAVDAQGNVIVAGSFSGTADFGAATLTSAGGYDALLAKLDSNGNPLWALRFGDTDDQLISAVAVDAIGNLIVTGTFFGSIDFGGGAITSAGGSDAFLAKLNGTGNHLWSKGFGDASAQYGEAVAIGTANGVVFGGELEGTIDLGGGMLVGAGNSDIYLANVDENGAYLWSERFGDAFAQTLGGIATSGAGTIGLIGYFGGTLDLGGGPLVSAGADDIFVGEVSGAGSHLWSRRFGDASSQSARAIALDGSGNVVVSGSFAGIVDFGGGPLAAMQSDVFVLKLDGGGNHVWSRRFGDAFLQQAYTIAVDNGESVYAAGGFDGNLDFAVTQLVSVGGDVWLAKISP